MLRMVMEVVMVLAVVGMMLFIMRVSKEENDSETHLQDHGLLHHMISKLINVDRLESTFQHNILNFLEYLHAG